MLVLFIFTEDYDSMVYLAITLPIVLLILFITLIVIVFFVKKKRWGIYFWNLTRCNDVYVICNVGNVGNVKCNVGNVGYTFSQEQW